jgi:hypothetical protein
MCVCTGKKAQTSLIAIDTRMESLPDQAARMSYSPSCRREVVDEGLHIDGTINRRGSRGGWMDFFPAFLYLSACQTLVFPGMKAAELLRAHPMPPNCGRCLVENLWIVHYASRPMR